MGNDVAIVDNASLTMSNFLTTSAYRLSLQEKRLFILTAHRVNPTEEPDSWKFKVTAEEWADLYKDSSGNCYRDLKLACERFTKQPWLRYKFKGETNRIRTCPWFSGIDYLKDEGAVVVEFSPGIRPFLCSEMLTREGYTSYYLLGIGKLRSEYSIRMYEWFLQFKFTGILIISIEEIRERLELKDKYPIYMDLKKRVIQKSVDDVTENSDYNVTFKVHKKIGRVINSLEFKIEKKKKPIQIN